MTSGIAAIAARAGDETPLHRLFGEDSSPWLAGVFCGIGCVMALSVAALVEQPAATPAPRAEPLAATEATQPAPPVGALSIDPPKATPPNQPMMAQAPPPASLSAPDDAPPPAAAPAPAQDSALVPIQPSVAPQEAARALVPAPVKTEASPGAAAAPCLPVAAIAFPRDSAKPLLDGAAAQAAPLLQWLKDHPKAVLVAEGHTDTTGAEAYNVVLSFKRAQAALAWLGGLGAPKDRMAARAAGPTAPRNGAAMLADNRQAVLQIEGVDICRDSGARDKP